MVNKINIIGTGNVAFHLCKILSELNFDISLFGRNQDDLRDFQSKFKIQVVDNIQNFRDELVLICVSDSNISEIIDQLHDSNKIAYTSGSINLNDLGLKSNLGVFYPLQTFTKDREINWFEIPIFIEANNEYFTQELFDLGWEISKKVEFANAEKRNQIHIAAVFANNFTNHLLHLSKEYLEKNNIDWQILAPLVKETIDKAFTKTPFLAQTGPAKRGDLVTIEKHKLLLDSSLLDIYNLLTNSLIETYKNEKL